MASAARALLDHLTSASRLRVGALVYGTPGANYEIGTGTLLRHGDHLYVLTCHHVADQFFRSKDAWVNFYKSEAASHEVRMTEVATVYEDAKLDTAILKVAQAASLRLRSLSPITIADLGNRPHYLRARSSKTTHPQFGICGFPGALAKYARRNVISMQPAGYGTFPCSPHPPNTLTFAYTEDETGEPPPAAPGLSGSLVWELAPPMDGKLWAPGKAIAMQHAWTVGTRLICSPIFGLRQWLLRA